MRLRRSGVYQDIPDNEVSSYLKKGFVKVTGAEEKGKAKGKKSEEKAPEEEEVEVKG